MKEPNRPRVVHVTTVPQTLRFLAGHVRALKTSGFQVSAISSAGGHLEEFALENDIPVFCVPMERRITPLLDLRALHSLVKIFRSEVPDIVHGHTPKGGLLAMVAACLASVPHRIYHIHGLPFLTATGPRRLLLKSSEKISCGLAHRVLCVSPSVRDASIENHLCEHFKILVFGSGSIGGVDTGKFNLKVRSEKREETRRSLGIPEEAPVLGFVGRLVRDKGLEELCKAWRLLEGSFPDLHAILVGPLEKRDALPGDVVSFLREHPRIRLIGEDWETPRYYSAIDFLVLPTYREGFPVVVLEGAAMGIPTVGTNVSGCRDAIVNGVTGTLIPPRQPHALARAIRQYLLYPEVLRRHGDQAEERVVRKFRPQDLYEATIQEYRKLLQRNRSRDVSKSVSQDKVGIEPTSQSGDSHGSLARSEKLSRPQKM